MVDTPAAAEIYAAARLAFDLPSDQEFLLADKDGHDLTNSRDLQQVVAQSETVYIRMSDSLLHGVERRIDQLQHMQIGYLCDQFATLRQEIAELRSDFKVLWQRLEQEQESSAVAKESAEKAATEKQIAHEDFFEKRLISEEKKNSEIANMLKEIEDACSISHQDMQQIAKEQETFRGSLLDVSHSLNEEALAREEAQRELHQNCQDLQDNLAAECKIREQAGERLQSEIEEMHQMINFQVGHREKSEVHVEQTLNEIRNVLDQVIDGQEREARDLRHEVQEMKQAIADQQREAWDLRQGVHEMKQTSWGRDIEELRHELQEMKQASDQTAEIGALVHRCARHEATLEAERLGREEVVAELTQQLSIAVESIQEEQTLRSSEDAELSEMAEELGRSVESLCRRVEESEHEVSNLKELLAQEVTVRQDADSKATRARASLQEGLADVHNQRARDMREAMQRFEACQASLKAEQKERTSLLEELSDRVVQVRNKVCEQSVPQGATWVRDIHELVDTERLARSSDISSLLERVEAIADTLAHLQKAFALEQKAVDEQLQQLHSSEIASSCTAAAPAEGPQGTQSSLEEVGSRIRTECLEVVSADLGALREGLAKIVEAVQQERRTRGDANAKLREDCREAIQKEIAARQEQTERLGQDLEAETRARCEALDAVKRAVAECRHGLETHTHELRVQD